MSKGIEAARAARDKAVELFGSNEQVSGIGITKQDGQYAVRINFQQAPDSASKLPEEIDGVPVVIRVTGTIHKQS